MAESPSDLLLDNDDPLRPVKLHLLQKQGVRATSLATVAGWSSLPIPQCLAAARVLCLREDEACGVQKQGTFDTINPRNEAAALSLLWAHCNVVCGKDAGRLAGLTELSDSYSQRTGQPGASTSYAVDAVDCDDLSPEAALFRWASSAGMRSSGLQAATCSDGLRGLYATQAISAGQTVLSVPSSLLITYETAKASDLGRALAALPQLSDETLALIWTMVDKHEEESPHAPFWRALPQSFGTGLSTSNAAVDLLRGTPLYPQARAARQHVQAVFQSLAPVFQTLLRAYPQYMQQQWFTEESYVWAVELWYAYAIEVSFPDGRVLSCLAPVVSLLNHSPWPHIVRFSRIDATTDRLELRMLRGCSAGEQVMLSYGPKTNQDLLLFYGFAVPGNPFDYVEVKLPVPKGVVADKTTSALEHHGLGLQHRLTRQQPLPAQLVAAARVLATAAATSSGSDLGDMQDAANAPAKPQQDDPFQPASRDVEVAALQLLRPTLMQAKLWRAAVDRVSAALAQSKGPDLAVDKSSTGAAPAGAQADANAGVQLDTDRGFLTHAAVMLQGTLSMLEAAAEQAAELEQQAAAMS